MEKEIVVKGDVEKARAYISSAGLFELSINGRRVGDEYLTPYSNTYSEWMQVISFDIGEYLHEGTNLISITLANGWYKGSFTFNRVADIYGDKLGAICEIHLDYADGGADIITSDLSWHSRASIFRSAEIYDGEVQDYTVSCDKIYPVTLLPIDKSLLSDRLSLPVVVKETRAAEKLIITPKGEKCLDFGQNMVGCLRIKVDLPRGKGFKLNFFEVFDAEGNYYNANLRTAKQEFCYISDGSAREVTAHFTYYGFRYVKIEGLDDICLDDFIGCVLYSDMNLAGNIETSNPLVNRLFLNALWGQKGNFVDVPTDCPQRDERLGWTGDAQIFCGTACYNMNTTAFFRKYLYDLWMEQKHENGCVPIYVPTFNPNAEDFECAAAWSDAAVVIPWQVYMHSGDISILEEQYESMKAWVEYVRKQDNGSYIWDKGIGFGDWLALDNPNPRAMTGITPKEMISTAYYYYSADLLSKAARVLGKFGEADEYSRLAKDIRSALRDNFVTKSGRIASDSQTSNVISLFMDFATDISYSVKLLNDKIYKNSDGYLNTGFVGTAYLCRVLSDNGYNDTAYKLLMNTDCPSWLYEVKKGATTIWERWDSIRPDGTLGDESMNSFNHYSYGAVVEWMYRNVAGIRPCEDAPGFKKAIIAPQPNQRLEWAYAEIKTIAGKYKSKWRISDQGLDFSFSVPFDCEAIVYLPDAPLEIFVNGEKCIYDECLVLNAGIYDISYMPTTVYLEKYTMDTSLKTILEKPQLKDAVYQCFPTMSKIPFYVIESAGDVALRQFLEQNHISFNKEDEEALLKEFAPIRPWDMD